jgi:hypothetical protein
MRAAVLAFAVVACSHPSYVGHEPTPFIVKGAGEPAPQAQQEAAQKRDAMAVQSAHASATSAELAKNGKSCSADGDCTGRLRCVAYRGVAANELRQCLFSCLDGCPEGWSCQTQQADGPKNTCEQAAAPR